MYFQRLQQVNSDNQRLRDENAALIRVIGKLSRNPLWDTSVDEQTVCCGVVYGILYTLHILNGRV